MASYDYFMLNTLIILMFYIWVFVVELDFVFINY